MTRLDALSDTVYDVLIIGAGIYGCTLACYAARAGWSVALIDQGDVGGGASANSLKIVHGGLRYLQQADVARVRESVRARRDAFRQLPHLARPLPCLVLTGGGLKRSPAAYRAAAWLYNGLSADRNKDVPLSHTVPASRYWSAEHVEEHCPALPGKGGALHWHDGIMVNSERFTLAYALSAREAGATIETYVAATRLLKQGDAVQGAHVRDLESGDTAEVRARLTINATGCWQSDEDEPIPYVSAYNVITDKQWFGPYAVGLDHPDPQAPQRSFFFVPWRQGTMIGTVYKAVSNGSPPPTGAATAPVADDICVEDFVQDINQIFPEAELKPSDVRFVHAGIQPARVARDGRVLPEPSHDTRIMDEAQTKQKGYWRVLGVKYTTAAVRAQATIKRWARREGRLLPDTLDGPLYGGGAIIEPRHVMNAAAQTGWDMNVETAQLLADQFGLSYPAILAIGKDDLMARECVPGTYWPRAAIIYILRNEQPLHVDDVLLRRTDIGSFARPQNETIANVLDMWVNERKGDKEKERARWENEIAPRVYGAKA